MAADFAEELVQDGWHVDLAHPGYVSRMKRNPDKTDFSDARMLADLTRVGYLPRVWLAPHAVRELRRLVRYRQQLVDEQRKLKQRIGAMLRDQRHRTGAHQPLDSELAQLAGRVRGPLGRKPLDHRPATGTTEVGGR